MHVWDYLHKPAPTTPSDIHDTGDGSVFQDVPGWVEVQELVEAAEDGGWWKELMDSV